MFRYVPLRWHQKLDAETICANERVCMSGCIACQSHLTHEDVEYPGCDGQGVGGEEDGEEPGGGVHGGVEALSLEVQMELREVLLRGPQTTRE